MPYPAQTTGLGVAVAVSLAGTGVVQEKTPVVGTQGISHYNVTLSLSGANGPSTVAVTATPIDVSGLAVAGPPAVIPALHLGTAAQYDILASASITNTGATTVAGGNLGLYPGTSVTGFPPGVVVPPATQQITTAAAQQAEADALTAYNYYSGLTFTSLGSAVNLSTSGNGSTAATYTAGNYSASSSMDIPTSITLDGQGNPNAIFVFKAGSTLTLESSASVLLINGAQAGNVYWVVGSSATTVATSTMVGTILAATSITLGGGALNGRALAGIVNSGSVTIAAATSITAPVILPPLTASALGINAVSYNAWPRKVAGVIQNKDGAARNQQDVTVSYPAPTSGPGGVADVVGTGSPVGNPFTVTSYRVGQAWVEFQIPTFLNTEGVGDTHSVDEDFDFPIDKIQAQLLVNVIA
jgi:hypothetical protein